MTTQEKLEQYTQKLLGYFRTLEDPSRSDMFIAGGGIRSIIQNESPKDIDVFFHTHVDLEKVKNHFKLHYKEAFISENAITLTIEGVKYQLITTCKGTPLTIVNEFDFTMNMNYYDFETKQTYVHDLISINSRKLVINQKCRNKIGTLGRIAKFVERGYRVPSKTDLVKLGVQISRLEPIDKFEKLQDECKLHFSEDEYHSFESIGVYTGIPYKRLKGYSGSAV